MGRHYNNFELNAMEARMNNNLTVSVIIPAYSIGKVKSLNRVIDSVLNQTVKPDEIIVAVDHNMALMNMFSVRKDIKTTLNNRIKGGAETRNTGIHTAAGDIVVFIDDDAWADRGWLENIIKLYDDPKVIAVGGKTISTWDKSRPSWFPEELDWLVGGIWKGHPEQLCEVRNLIGPNMSFRKEVCKTIGYMRAELGAKNSSFRPGDEPEFFIRLKHYFPDYKIMYEPKAVVYHSVPDGKITPVKLCQRSFSLGYYKALLTKDIAKFTPDPSSTEKRYLWYLILESIPSKLLQGRFSQTISIIASILCTGLGYIKGRLK